MYHPNVKVRFRKLLSVNLLKLLLGPCSGFLFGQGKTNVSLDGLLKVEQGLVEVLLLLQKKQPNVKVRFYVLLVYLKDFLVQ